MDARIIILLFAALANLMFGGLILLKNKKRLSNFMYFFMTIFIAFRAIGRIYLEKINTGHPYYMLVELLMYAFAATVMNGFFLFTLAFLSEYFNIQRVGLKMLATSGANLLIVLLLLSGKIVTGYDDSAGIVRVTFNSLGYFVYATYVVVFFLVPCYLLAKRFFEEKGILKSQVGFILTGAGLSGSTSIITNIILPAFGNFEYFWLGSIFPLFMVTFMAAAILKHHLLEIRLITAEIFTGLMIIISFLRFLFSKGTLQFAVDSLIFIFVSVFGFLLVRSILKEIKTRERMEQLAEQLQMANIQLKKLDEEKSEFLSIASHQLRTPMTITKGYISLIREGLFGEFPEKANEAIEKVYASNERLLKLTNDLLDLSRIERGKMVYSMQKQSFNKLVEDIIEELRPLALSKKLKFSFEKPNTSGLPEISFDRDYMRQVIFNIIDNAIKYTEMGGIEIAITQNPEAVVLAVKDTGIGIEGKDKETIFQHYQRSGRTTSEYNQGLGLGLYVAKKIVDDHSGRIWAESDGPGRGSTFYVEMPIA